MTAVEALKFALKKEEAAIELYRKMADDHPSARDLFYSLVNEEEKHRKLIIKKLSDMSNELS